MRPLTRLMGVVLLVATGLILAGCGGSADEAPAVAALPDWVMSAPCGGHLLHPPLIFPVKPV